MAREGRRPYNKGVIGGTFDILHVGHKALIWKALSDCDMLYIGITSDSLATFSKKRSVNPFDERATAVSSFVAEIGARERVKIVAIEDPFGPSVEDPELEALFVTEGVLANAFRVNELRKAKGMKNLDIVVIPFVKAENGDMVSSTRVRLGEVNAEGSKAQQRS